ncbi:PTB domain-containing engulfment adapter protein 1 [Armadillidium nasatum]|uniref:PTB domain-containing engulfment adapter protein 1 n=1 Tax=Armadillidium nasatum TaxID=96803 RepID=A0A5N5SMW5_9CRUS|nr:PTB domain-containing engulfment adapter protein 1 [Armadillidium nasatum]
MEQVSRCSKDHTFFKEHNVTDKTKVGAVLKKKTHFEKVTARKDLTRSCWKTVKRKKTNVDMDGLVNSVAEGYTKGEKEELDNGANEYYGGGLISGNKNWIHPPETLQGGHIVYLVKFLGSTEVSQSKGIEVVKEAITKLRFNQQIKKTEGAKTPKVELTISKVLYQYPLHQISYCADDKAEKRFFSFIAKESDREAHTCFVFISDKLAEEITLTIGQAFDLAYRKFLETSTREGELRRQLMTLRQQLQLLEKEKSTLEDRLKQVAALKDRQDLSRYMEENGISDLLFMNGVQSTEEPILHSPSGSSSDHSNLEPINPLNLPPVPPRNNSKGDILENIFEVYKSVNIKAVYVICYKLNMSELSLKWRYEKELLEEIEFEGQ